MFRRKPRNDTEQRQVSRMSLIPSPAPKKSVLATTRALANPRMSTNPPGTETPFDIVNREAVEQLEEDLSGWYGEFESWSTKWQTEIREFTFENIKKNALEAYYAEKTCMASTDELGLKAHSVTLSEVNSKDLLDIVANKDSAEPYIVDYSTLLDDYSHQSSDDSSSVYPTATSSPGKGRDQIRQQGKISLPSRTSPPKGQSHRISSRRSILPYKLLKPFDSKLNEADDEPDLESDTESIGGSAVVAYYDAEANTPEMDFDTMVDITGNSPKSSPIGRKYAPHAYASLAMA